MTVLETLLQCAWKSIVLLGAGFVASALLRRKSAALRHALWTACFAGLLLLPAAIPTLPAWSLLASRPAPPPQVVVSAPIAVVTLPTATLAPRAVKPRTFGLLTIWLAGAGAVALWYLIGVLRISWMLRRAVPAGDAAELAASLGIRRTVRVLRSDAAPMPMMWGIFRPVVILPSDADGWFPARLRTVLLHELVHIRRLDLLAQVVGQAACCLYWFHPLVWLAAAQLRKEREQACDDSVLARGVSAPEYAGHLMDLVRAMAARRGSWSQAPAMAETSGLESRVRALLDRRRDRTPLSRHKISAIAASGMALVLPLAAFSDSRPAAPRPSVTAAAAVLPAPAVQPAPIATRAVRRPKLVALASAAEPAPPQIARGSLIGTVRDPSGAVVPGCRVSIRNSDGSTQQEAVSDAAGQYRFAGIPAGDYQVQVDASGFAPFKLAGVPVPGGSALQINANLSLGSMSEAVTVQGKKSATAPAPQTAPQRIRVGGNVQPARLVRQQRPVYPAELQQLGVEGTVQLKAIISKEGVPISLQVVGSPDPRLVPLALDAVGQWRYQPTLLNGEPVETATTIDVAFTLGQ